jgi:hypothetical protein
MPYVVNYCDRSDEQVSFQEHPKGVARQGKLLPRGKDSKHR